MLMDEVSAHQSYLETKRMLCHVWSVNRIKTILNLAVAAATATTIAAFNTLAYRIVTMIMKLNAHVQKNAK